MPECLAALFLRAKILGSKLGAVQNLRAMRGEHEAPLLCPPVPLTYLQQPNPRLGKVPVPTLQKKDTRCLRPSQFLIAGFQRKVSECLRCLIRDPAPFETLGFPGQELQQVPHQVQVHRRVRDRSLGWLVFWHRNQCR